MDEVSTPTPLAHSAHLAFFLASSEEMIFTSMRITVWPACEHIYDSIGYTYNVPNATKDDVFAEFWG